MTQPVALVPIVTIPASSVPVIDGLVPHEVSAGAVACWVIMWVGAPAALPKAAVVPVTFSVVALAAAGVFWPMGVLSMHPPLMTAWSAGTSPNSVLLDA